MRTVVHSYVKRFSQLKFETSFTIYIPYLLLSILYRFQTTFHRPYLH